MSFTFCVCNAYIEFLIEFHWKEVSVCLEKAWEK